MLSSPSGGGQGAAAAAGAEVGAIAGSIPAVVEHKYREAGTRAGAGQAGSGARASRVGVRHGVDLELAMAAAAGGGAPTGHVGTGGSKGAGSLMPMLLAPPGPLAALSVGGERTAPKIG